MCSGGGPGLHCSCVLIFFRRIREKYEAELKEAEKSERSTLEKFNTMKVITEHQSLLVCTLLNFSHYMSYLALFPWGGELEGG